MSVPPQLDELIEILGEPKTSSFRPMQGESGVFFQLKYDGFEVQGLTPSSKEPDIRVIITFG